MRVSILSGALIVGLAGLTSPARAAEHTRDSTDAVKKALADDKAVLLDVREKSEWDDGHLKDARLLPLSVLQAGAKAEDVAGVVPKGKIVYCHCGSGARCLKAADALQKLGYDVRPLKPGYKDLLKAGFAPADKWPPRSEGAINIPEDEPMRAILTAAAAVCLTVCAGAEPASETKLVFPIIPNVGGVAPLPKAAEQPRKGAKVVFDITADAKPADVNKGLERVARLLNLYGSAGLKASDVKIALVLHGEATKSALADDAYKAKFGADRNPNLPVLRDLQKAGVEVFVCGQAMSHKGFKESEVAKDVSVALAALTVVVNRQTDGYAYVPAN